MELVDFARLFFTSFPWWVKALLGLREAGAALIGLKTANHRRTGEERAAFQGRVGDSVMLFDVLGRSTTEILFVQNDRHLDFRLSVFLEKSGTSYTAMLATSVRFNGRLGRAYFLPVRPVHRRIMPIALRRMIRTVQGQ